MSVRLTTDEQVCALFDSVTGWAFGPTFGDSDAADNFLAFLAEHGEDGRELSTDVLSKRHDEWLARGGDERAGAS